MDWTSLLLSASGRIGRIRFWLASAISLPAIWVALEIPRYGPIIALPLLYCWTCVSTKRLHDMGKSMWFLAAWAAAAAACATAGVGGAAYLTSGWPVPLEVQPPGNDGEDHSWLYGIVLFLGTIIFEFVMFVAFMFWLGLTAGQPEANEYGDPVSAHVGRARS